MTNDLTSTQKRGPSCRHFSALDSLRSRTGCKIGHKIEARVAALSGTKRGLYFMLPCRPGADTRVACADYSPYTPEELAEREAKAAAEMAIITRGLPALEALRDAMVAEGRGELTADCPWCGAVDALNVTCAVTYNNHVHARCAACKRGVLE